MRSSFLSGIEKRWESVANESKQNMSKEFHFSNSQITFLIKQMKNYNAMFRLSSVRNAILNITCQILSFTRYIRNLMLKT